MYNEIILDKLSSVLQATSDRLAGDIVKALDNANRIFVAGAGRSGLVSRLFAMRLMHSGYQVYVVGEVVTPSIRDGDLLLVISGSGSTETLLPLVRKAKRLGAQVALVSMKSKSPIAEQADLICAIGSGAESTFAEVKGMPMGTVFELSALIFLEAIIFKIVYERELTEDGMRALHANLE